MVTIQEQSHCTAQLRSDFSSHELSSDLRRRFTPRQAAYISHVLTPAELAVVADPGDALIIARIKRMPNSRLQRFDDLVPVSPEQVRRYRLLQLQWLRDEEYLLGTRLGRKPTEKELFIDFMNNHNGLRFRAYFALKFPDQVTPKNKPAP